jgi:hypothetical protein
VIPLRKRLCRIYRLLIVIVGSGPPRPRQLSARELRWRHSRCSHDQADGTIHLSGEVVDSLKKKAVLGDAFGCLALSAADAFDAKRMTRRCEASRDGGRIPMVDCTAEALQEDGGAIAAAAIELIGQAPILGFDELDPIRMHGSSPQHMIAAIL